MAAGSIGTTGPAPLGAGYTACYGGGCVNRTSCLIASIVAGALVVAVFALYGSTVRGEAERAQREALAAYGGELVTVCVASRDIDRGEVLDETNIQVEEWVASLLPEGAMTSLDACAGKQVTSSIPARAVLSPVYFESVGSSIEVPEGRVAVSVPADEKSAVGGAVRPGNAVDVYVSSDGVTDMLCRATVIDTSERAEGSESAGIAWVTLAAEPEDVPEILTATTRGSVSLVLPGEQDEGSE